ncbi:MAG: hypothetical protein ABL921_31680, partial [Pirellula sp.]
RVLQTAALLGKWATAERIQAVLEYSASDFLGIIVALENDGMFSASRSGDIRCHELMAAAALARLRSLSLAALQRRIGHALEIEIDRDANDGLLLKAIEHLWQAGETRRLLRLCERRSKYLSSWSQPIEILRHLVSIDVASISVADSITRGNLCSRLRVECGLYGAEIAARGGSAGLPRASARISTAQAEAGLSIVDSSYRADFNADRDRLADYTISIARLTHLPSPVRLRAAGIGFVILSNLCDDARAHALWNALERKRATESFEYERVAVLYHTIFGDLDQATELATRLLHQAVQHPDSLLAPADALRAGFALRIASPDFEHLKAFEYAFTSAQALTLPAYSINAAWQLAQCYLDLGQHSQFEYWIKILQQLHEMDSDRLSSSFVPALLCRRAIADGHQVAASAYYEAFSAANPTKPTIRTQSHAVALRLAIELIDTAWTPRPRQVAEICEAAEGVLRFGSVDFLASVWVRVLARTSPTTAAAQLTRYLAELRRDRGVPSLAISELTRTTNPS